MENQVNKLRIVKLKDPRDYFKGEGFLDKAIGSLATLANWTLASVFEVQINPEHIQRNFTLSYNDSSEHGVNRQEAQPYRPRPESLELKFILDGTGALQDNSITQMALDAGGPITRATGTPPQAAYVSAKMALLQAVVYDYIDETHNPPLLVVSWGKLVFIGRLNDMAVNYNLFTPAGIPLRAEVTLKMQSEDLGMTASKITSFLSPDLTRRRIIRGSDNLPNVCQNVYDSEKYYLEVAKANDLTNFRKIEPGKELNFPPIDKRLTK